VSTTEIDDEFDLSELPDSVDQSAVKRMKVAAWLLDDAIRIPGTKFKIGIDPIVGVLPVGGDAATGVASLYIVAESARLGVERETLLAQLVNVAIDVGAGSVPVLGDLFDASWKSNKRNLELAVDDLTRGETAGSDSDSNDDGVNVSIE